MNLICGKIVAEVPDDFIQENLSRHIIETIAKEKLDVKVVVNACDKLVNSVEYSKFLQIAENLSVPHYVVESYYQQLKNMFSKESLEYRLEKELGKNYMRTNCFTPLGSDKVVCEKVSPLGVLFHIAAGNADGLPAYSVIEGLLAGNINILKLPSQADGGLTIQLLSRLIEIEPELNNYIYVFDYSSKEEQRIMELIELSDAVVVWGSDVATASLRKLVHPNVKLVEWGHKISFAYATKKGLNTENMQRLARHICETNQLLCSSCQGIYIDTDDSEFIDDIARKFHKILQKISDQYPQELDLGIRSRLSLQLLNEEIDSIDNKQKIYKEKDTSVIVAIDSELTSSYMHRNVWIKALPKEKFLSIIRKHKNHLQTISLLCETNEMEDLRTLALKTGIVKVTDVSNMSKTYCGEAHDGEYSLRRYTKIVSWEGDAK